MQKPSPLSERARLCRPFARARLLLAVLVHMRLCGVLSVPSRVVSVAHRRNGMMGCLLVMAGLVMLGSFHVMSGYMCRMLSCLPVMIGCFFRHFGFPLSIVVFCPFPHDGNA